MAERMSGVHGVLNYAGCFVEAAVSGESMDGRLVCVMDWATFMTFCCFLRSWQSRLKGPNSLHQTVIQPERMLSIVHL